MAHAAGTPGIPSLQVAFQGGGTKFVNLMAAAHALQDAHHAEEIKITRVSGTSAGAIVASLIAAGADFSKVSQFLSEAGHRHLNALTRGKSQNTRRGIIRLALCAWMGKAAFDQCAFNTFLAELFRASVGSVPASISDTASRTGIELLITASDLRESAARRLRSDAPLVQAIANSCAIPLFFRGHSDLRVNSFVDGGLCENLPVEGLLDDIQALGDVFAVTPHVEETALNRAGLLPYLMRLFDVSIENSVKRSRLLIEPNNLIEIPTTLGTFEFAEALKQLLGSAPYSLAYKNTTDRIKKYRAACKVNRNRSPTIHDVQAELNHVKRSMAAVYDSVFSKNDLAVLRTSLIVYGELLDKSKPQNERRPDIIRREVLYRLGADPIYCIRVQMESDGNAISPRPLRHSVVRTSDGFKFESHLVAIEGKPLSRPERRPMQCLLFFDTPLRANSDCDEIEVRWDYQIADCMLPIISRGNDELSILNPRRYAVPLIDIILMVPTDFRGNIEYFADNRAGALNARQLSLEEITSAYKGIDTINYLPIGVRGENLQTEQRFVVGFWNERRWQGDRQKAP